MAVMRPLCVGFVIEPTLDSVRYAARLACTAWGGGYSVILPNTNNIESVAEAFLVDFLYQPDAEDPLCNPDWSPRYSPRFTWRRLGTQGDPFSPALDERHHAMAGLLDVLKLPPLSSQHLLPSWAQEDPLADLFLLWFGAFPDNERGQLVQQHYSRRSDPIAVDRETVPPEALRAVSPASNTFRETFSTRIDQNPTFVAVDPSEPLDLMFFWNIRAFGIPAFPWPIRDHGRLSNALQTWVDEVAGTTASVQVAIPPGATYDVEQLWEALGERPIQQVSHDIFLTGWRGFHPIGTNSQRYFERDVAVEEHAAIIPLPTLGFLTTLDHYPGHVATDVLFFGAKATADRTVLAPAVSESSSFLRGSVRDLIPCGHYRPEGLTVGLQAHARQLDVPILSNTKMVRRLLGDDFIDGNQSDNGHFTARLGDRLGGTAAESSNQPALRHVLLKGGRGEPDPLPALIQAAEDGRGNWPSILDSVRTGRDYAVRVVNSLLDDGLLRPFLQVRCPECRLKANLAPDDINSTFQCGMCRVEHELGLVISLDRQPREKWVFGLAGNVSPAMLAEALPTLAATSVLANYGRNGGIDRARVFGLKLNSNPPREADVCLMIDDYQLPCMVIGEVKSVQEGIDGNDLQTLNFAQERGREAGLECYTMVASLREALCEGELSALSAACEGAPAPLYPHTTPHERIFPIVFTKLDLSLPWSDQSHPSRRVPAPHYLNDLAKETYERNVGEPPRRWILT